MFIVIKPVTVAEHYVWYTELIVTHNVLIITDMDEYLQRADIA